jgi:hypothetical protein
MAFREILKKQRQSGGGLISSIAAASNKSMLESIDPRNKIFKKGSLLNSLFPNVKGYKAEGEKSMASAVAPQQTSSIATVEVLAKLDVLADKMDIVGKNTMVMPLMMRDSNIMRQSMIKLVKLSGGTQRDKADRFFQTSKNREMLYESQFKKTPVKPTSPTPAVTKTDSGDGGGFLNMLLKGLLAGGILAGIGKLMEDPAIREIVKEYVQKFVTSVFDGLKFILSTIMDTELDIEGFKMSLGTAIAGTIAAFVGFKLAIAALTAYITSKIGGASIPSPGIPDGPDRGKPGGKTPVPGAPGTPGKTDEKPKKAERYRDPKTGRFAKMPKPGTTPAGGVGRALSIAAILGLAVDLVYTSDDEIAILRDDGFSKSKVFDKLTEEEQDDYLEKVYRKDFKESDLKAEREALMKKYNLEATGAILRWKEKYVEKPASATPVPQASVRAVDNELDKSTPASKTPMKATESTPSKLPTNSGTNSVIPGDKTFNQMTRAEQDSLLMNQAIAEGWKKPTSIQHSHNNPGNIIAPGGKVTPAQAKFGGIPGGTYNGLTFVKFPTMQDGWEAQRDLWTRKYGNQPVSKALATWSDAGKDQGNYNKVALGGGGDSPAPILSSAPTVATTTSPATVASAPSKPAVQIASASTSLADTMRAQMQTPVVINAPTTNNNMQNASNGGQRSTTTPSIVDSELMKLLVERVAA